MLPAIWLNEAHELIDGTRRRPPRWKNGYERSRFYLPRTTPLEKSVRSRSNLNQSNGQSMTDAEIRGSSSGQSGRGHPEIKTLSR